MISVALTSDGRRVISASHDKTLKVWDLATGALLRTLEGHTARVTAVALTSDGRRAISASYDQTLKVWDVASGALLLTLQGHTDWVMSVALTSDGRHAVSASRDKTLKVWDFRSAEPREEAVFTVDAVLESVAVWQSLEAEWFIIVGGDASGAVHILRFLPTSSQELGS